MGFLHKLWDETLAGPTPETGLGKLRKYNSFSTTTNRSQVAPVGKDVPISRSITIVRTHSNFRTTTSDPVSPSVPITPRSPLTPETPGGDFKKFTRRKSSEGAAASGEHRSLR
ncbi:dormancy-associated protein homolog 4 isoform X2 [Gastrolobium bilobum]|uniref:dormancy-associated protein homolog 4 isoform X2 n=1 Tax=Gastrolobium bilobum TaxID=150636 RepID=UPI002AB01F7A|nr:dormancy-associated protein homolog 4 isoform X2 [Gastrolobium bilobum]